MSGRLVLVRHGQSFANVDKRLDTRPPGAELTALGREQARAFARDATSVPGLLLHSVATRAAQTAAEISAEFDVPAREVTGIHEVQVGDLENRNDQDAVDEFDAIYRRWLRGRARRADARRGKRRPGAGPLSAGAGRTDGSATSTTTTGPATSSSSATARRSG